MKENNSRLFVAATIIIVLLLGLFMVFGGRIFDWLSKKSISSAIPAETSLPGTTNEEYFDTSIFSDKQFDGLKDSSSGFEFDTVGKKTMPPAQNIFDDQGNLIGKQVPAKTYVGNNRPF